MSSNISTTLHATDLSDEKTLRLYLDGIMNEIPVDDNKYLHEIVNHLIESKSPVSDIIDHAIFVRIRDKFVDILQKSMDDFDLLRCIGDLFSQIADHVDDKNIDLFQELFADETIILYLGKYMKNLSPTSHENLIDGIGNMIDVYQKFQQDRPDIKDKPILSALVMPIVNFVKSAEYTTSFFQLSSEQNQLTSFQKLILITCPKYIVSFWCERQKEVALAAAQQTLSRSSEILNHFLPFIDDWNEAVIWCVFYLIWLSQYSADDYLLSAYNLQHRKMLDCALEIVQGEKLLQLANQNCSSDKLQKRASQLFCYTTLYIYATSFSPQLRYRLKENNITPIILRLTKTNFDKTQFHAYRILAVVLSSDDIKQLANPSQITTVFITYLEKSMKIGERRQRLENLLLNFKNLIQHDQIKAEFVKQVHGLSLLIRCATESRFDPIRVQLCAIEVLMCLTFNNEGKAYLKQNNTFVQYLQSLTSNSSIPRLQKAADGILWRLFSKDKQTEDEFQYDVMISYSHKDKDMCYQIHQALVADNFRVWIDLEGMYGVLMQVMADAIEQSRYIIICMSESYYLSPYCQAEAQYAFEKRRGLIPLKVQSGYRADGWLAFLTSGRMHVDFMKMNFDIAYKQLVLQMNQSQACGRRLSIAPESNLSESSTIRHKHTANTYSSNVLQWTPTDVSAFLRDKQLDQMMSICNLMDGRTLMELYQMCLINPPVMLQTLRAETVQLHSRSLSTNSYLIFLREMKHLTEKENIRDIKSRFHICTLI